MPYPAPQVTLLVRMETPSPSSLDDAAPSVPPVRAFAQGTGVLLQVVGIMLFLVTSCMCVFAGVWDPPLSKDAAAETLEKEADPQSALLAIAAEPGRLGKFLTVVISSVAGLSLAVFGLGLQSDKPRAALGAVITAFLWLATLLTGGVMLWTGAGTIAMRIWNFLLVAAAAIVLAFTIAALRQVLRHPPPKGLEILPPDFEIPKSYKH
ncbi:MAG: hypothetical protein WD768_06050 [Phycisphaeraceae bacterium]